MLGTDTKFVVQLGGIGFLHYNMTVEEQVSQIKIVKAHIIGFLVNPPILRPSDGVSEYLALLVRDIYSEITSCRSQRKGLSISEQPTVKRFRQKTKAALSLQESRGKDTAVFLTDTGKPGGQYKGAVTPSSAEEKTSVKAGSVADLQDRSDSPLLRVSSQKRFRSP